MRKVEKALEIDGPSFINVLSPCPRGWRSQPDSAVELSRIAVATCVWPVYEVEQGEWRMSHKPREKLPVSQWFEAQGRFSHLFQEDNRHLLEDIQAQIDEEWQTLLDRCRSGD